MVWPVFLVKLLSIRLQFSYCNILENMPHWFCYPKVPANPAPHPPSLTLLLRNPPAAGGRKTGCGSIDNNNDQGSKYFSKCSSKNLAEEMFKWARLTQVILFQLLLLNFHPLGIHFCIHLCHFHTCLVHALTIKPRHAYWWCLVWNSVYSLCGWAFVCEILCLKT